jgi:hypothetical protein
LNLVLKQHFNWIEMASWPRGLVASQSQPHCLCAPGLRHSCFGAFVDPSSGAFEPAGIWTNPDLAESLGFQGKKHNGTYPTRLHTPTTTTPTHAPRQVDAYVQQAGVAVYG